MKELNCSFYSLLQQVDNFETVTKSKIIFSAFPLCCEISKEKDLIESIFSTSLYKSNGYKYIIVSVISLVRIFI